MCYLGNGDSWCRAHCKPLLEWLGIPLEANWFMPLFIIVWVAMMIIPGHILNHKAKQG